ncbi:uncharacterized protein [Haliotis cracherodii]|uniref:uncharacterized protein n=1 Tax=Haliotis cracherodii TaxID=6455 RepID=UPI0039E8AF7A
MGCGNSTSSSGEDLGKKGEGGKKGKELEKKEEDLGKKEEDLGKKGEEGKKGEDLGKMDGKADQEQHSQQHNSHQTLQTSPSKQVPPTGQAQNKTSNANTPTPEPTSEIKTKEKEHAVPTKTTAEEKQQLEGNLAMSSSPRKTRIQGASQGKTTLEAKKIESEANESYLPLEPESQRRFDATLQCCCLLLTPDSVMNAVDKNVTRLQLHNALPSTHSVFHLVKKLQNLRVLDLSGNNLGPQGFRSVCLAMCSNTSVIRLNLADNRCDTDSAECVGRLVAHNTSLVYLDVSSNNLGKDYFSRCVGPALKSNSTLQTLRAKSIGSTNMKVLLDVLVDNITLSNVDLSSNGLSDRASLGTAFSHWIKKPGCCLTCVSLSSCEMNPASLSLLCDAMSHNNSLTEINLNGNEFGSLKLVARFIASACHQGKVRNLHLNDARVTDQAVSVQDLPEQPDPTSVSPALQVLSLHSSNIADSLFSVLRDWTKGRQLHITDLDVTNNQSLTPDCVEDIISMTSDSSGHSSLQRFSYGLNSSDTLPQKLNISSLPCLTYLNLRKAKISAARIVDICGGCLSAESVLSMLVLDGLKLAGTDVVPQLCGHLKHSKVTTLSFGGCSLADSDLSTLCDLIGQGHPIHMLKLSANRITDTGVRAVVESLLKQTTHPLGVLDLSNNTIGSDGAATLSQLYLTKTHQSSLHSLNLAGNTIRKDGVISLISVLGEGRCLKTVYLNGQRDAISEVDMEDVYGRLAATLGFKVCKVGDNFQPNSSDLPSLPENLIVNLKHLGGQPGSLGKLLHSSAIVTDTTQDLLTGLTLSGVLEISAALKGLGSAECVMSAEEWNLITGANKDREVPSWLQLPDHRQRAVYLCGLPGNVSVQKLEGMLEMEADCSVEEVVLIKDPVTKSNTGVAWVLFSDGVSVDKAIDFYHQGEAKIFGQPFSISRICVKIDDEMNLALEAKARQDQETRLQARRAEDAAHRALILQNTEESWKRHAYRLAHPAYADGRIW